MQHQNNNNQNDNNQNDNNQNDNNQNDNNQEPAEHPTSSDIQQSNNLTNNPHPHSFFSLSPYVRFNLSGHF